MFGINYIGSQWYGHISIYCYTHLQLEHLLHKTVLVMFSWPALYFDQLEIPLKVMLTAWTSGSKQIWIRSFKWGTIEPCRLKDWKVTSLQIWPRLELEPGPPSSIAILAESDQEIVIIFDRKHWQPIGYKMTLKVLKYFIWKIWFISLWSQKIKNFIVLYSNLK